MSEQEDVKRIGAQPAFPQAIVSQPGHYASAPAGMTLRQHYAGLAMQALLSDPNAGKGMTDGDKFRALIAVIAVACADALLAELTKP